MGLHCPQTGNFENFREYCGGSIPEVGVILP